MKVNIIGNMNKQNFKYIKKYFTTFDNSKYTEDYYKKLIFSKNKANILESIKINDSNNIHYVKSQSKNILTLFKLLRKMNNNKFDNLLNKEVIENLQKCIQRLHMTDNYIYFYIMQFHSNNINRNLLMKKLNSLNKDDLIKFCVEITKSIVLDKLKTLSKLEILDFISFIISRNLFSEDKFKFSFELKMLKNVLSKELNNNLSNMIILNSDSNQAFKIYIKIVNQVLSIDSSRVNILFNLITYFINSNKYNFQDVYFEVYKLIYEYVTKYEEFDNNFIENIITFRQFIKNEFSKNTCNEFHMLLNIYKYDNLIEYKLVSTSSPSQNYIRSNSLLNEVIKQYNKSIVRDKVFILYFIFSHSTDSDEKFKILNEKILEDYNLIYLYLKQLNYKRKSDTKIKNHFINILESMGEFNYKNNIHERKYIDYTYEIKLI